MKNNTIKIIFLFIIFIITLYVATFAISNDLGYELFKNAFIQNNNTNSILLYELRYPRVLKALVAGICLAISGMFMQAISKNPLAEPYITGVSSGAGVGIVFSILFFEGINYALFGFLGALLSSFTVIILCGLNRFSISKLILFGLSINMFASSIIAFLILLNPTKSYGLMYILSGSVVHNIGMKSFVLIMLFIILLGLSAIFIPKLNFLRLDNSMLTNYKRKKDIYTIIILIISSCLTSLSVLCAGILAFIGIICPQISKILVGNDYRWQFFANIFIGSILILLSDFISRVLLYPIQIPLGLVITIIGTPIFVYFLLKKGVFFND